MVLKQYFASVFAADLKPNENDNKNELTETKDKNQNTLDNKDEPNDEVKTLIEEDIKIHLLTETGKDRLKAMFSTEKSDKLSPQLKFAAETAFHTGIFTCIATFMFGARAAGNKFIEKHAHKTFNTKFNALRTYHDIMMFGGLRFGMRMGAKTGCFTWIFLFTSQLISTYRNKSSVIDYVAAGALTCGLLRMNLGLRGIFAGSVIGSFFGLVGGSALVVLVKLRGLDQADLHHGELYNKYAAIREFKKLSNDNNDVNTFKSVDNNNKTVAENA